MVFLLTSDQKLSTRTLILEGWSISVDRKHLSGVDWALLIDWLTNNVHNSSKSLWSDWNHNWRSGISDGLSSNETFSGIQSDSSDVVTTQMLGDLKNESVFSALDLKGVHNLWKVTLELDIDDGTDDLRDLSNCGLRGESPYLIEKNMLEKHS